jgi:hypothetical protein
MGQKIELSTGLFVVALLSPMAALAASYSSEPQIVVRELSRRQLGLMGISENSFQQPQYQYYTLPTWTIPTGEQTQGSGGNPPPCPKDVPGLPTNPPPFFGTTGPILGTAPVGCTPTTPNPGGPGTPGTGIPGTQPGGGTIYIPPTTDPIPTSGGVIGDIGGSVIIFEHIINIGKEVWQFVKDGHAVVNVDMPSASALPQGVTSAAELEGWEPLTKNYQVIVPDSKKRQIEFVFRLTLWYNGSYHGTGAYISNLTVQAADYKVNWGQEFNVRARIPAEGLVNVSKVAGQPIAGAQVLVEWSRGKTWSTQGNSAVIYVRGDGQIKNLSAPDEEPEDLYPIGKGSHSRH